MEADNNADIKRARDNFAKIKKEIKSIQRKHEQSTFSFNMEPKVAAPMEALDDKFEQILIDFEHTLINLTNHVLGS